MTSEIMKLWPELEWITDKQLREKTARTWEVALERSVLTSKDLERIPFTLLCGPLCLIKGAWFISPGKQALK